MFSKGRKRRLKERSNQPNPTGETQMAQVTYRGVQYDTKNRPNQNTQQNDTPLVYRGIKVAKGDK